jgi:hypothetical protein
MVDAESEIRVGMTQPLTYQHLFTIHAGRITR